MRQTSFYTCVPKIMIMMYCFWDIRHSKQFFVILDHILPFDLTINPKNQNFKMPRDIVILHLSTINDNHMRYGFWDVEHNRQFFFVILDHFFTLITPKKPKINILKKWKNTWRYYHSTHVYHKWQSYDIWFLRYGAQQRGFFVILDHFLPFNPTNPKNQNFEKMKKPPWDIIILHKCAKNHDHMLHCSWDLMRSRYNFYFSF